MTSYYSARHRTVNGSLLPTTTPNPPFSHTTHHDHKHYSSPPQTLFLFPLRSVSILPFPPTTIYYIPADVVECFIVYHEGAISVFQSRVRDENGIVRLDDGRRYLRRERKSRSTEIPADAVSRYLRRECKSRSTQIPADADSQYMPVRQITRLWFFVHQRLSASLRRSVIVRHSSSLNEQ